MQVYYRYLQLGSQVFQSDAAAQLVQLNDKLKGVKAVLHYKHVFAHIQVICV